MAVVQRKEDINWYWGGNSRDSEKKWLDCAYILKIELPDPLIDQV